MSSVVGDVSDLSSKTVVVPVVQSLTGNSVSFNFKVADDPSIRHYLASFASVSIVGPITFEISAPATSTVAASAVVAVCPDKYADWPTTRLQVQRLEGNVHVKDAILVPTSLVVEGRVREVSSSLQPKTLLGYPPVVVGHLVVAGGSATTVTTLTAHISLQVDGIAHFRTW